MAEIVAEFVHLEQRKEKLCQQPLQKEARLKSIMSKDRETIEKL